MSMDEVPDEVKTFELSGIFNSVEYIDGKYTLIEMGSGRLVLES